MSDCKECFDHCYPELDKKDGRITFLQAELSRLREELKTSITYPELMKERDLYKSASEELVKALELVDEVWERSNLHPDINFMGDDEHEAWGNVKEAIAKHRQRLAGEGQ